MRVQISEDVKNKTINVTARDDNEFEGNETFILGLNFTAGGETHRLMLAQPSAKITILDNDSKLFFLKSVAKACMHQNYLLLML